MLRKTLVALVLLGCGDGDASAPSANPGPSFCPADADVFAPTAPPGDDSPLAETAVDGSA